MHYLGVCRQSLALSSLLFCWFCSMLLPRPSSCTLTPKSLLMCVIGCACRLLPYLLSMKIYGVKLLRFFLLAMFRLCRFPRIPWMLLALVLIYLFPFVTFLVMSWQTCLLLKAPSWRSFLALFALKSCVGWH